MRSNKEQLIVQMAMAILLLLLAYQVSAKTRKPGKVKDPRLPKHQGAPGSDNAERYFKSLKLPGNIDFSKHGAMNLPGAPVFDITKYGAKGNGKPNLDQESGEDSDLNTLAFIQAWKAACEKTEPVVVLIPPGDFVMGQTLLTGPCNSSLIKVENQGTLLANTDLSLYPSAEWISFEYVQHVIFTGSGKINAQGEVNWPHNTCKQKKSKCAPLPSSLKLHRVNNTMVTGITSVNSMFFHIFLGETENVTIQGVNLMAPNTSPNTDGIHTSRSRHIKISNSIIGTGDDCVSIGQGSIDISVSNITCGPGHGISIGSLGKENEERDVRGIRVRNCTLKQTDNGVRIKTYAGKVDTMAQHILFENIVLDFVKHPIIIDTTYSNAHHSVGKGPSHVKLSDIQFKNIRGTSAKEDIVTLNCSAAVPCDKVKLIDIEITPPPNKPAITHCYNAKVNVVNMKTGLKCASKM